MLKVLPVGVTAMGRDCKSRTGCPLSRSVCSVRAPRRVSLNRLSGRKLMREKLWREFFSDPSQWWDHRSEKVNSRYPDFKQKKTGQSLWIIDNRTPAWVESELAALSPGLLQSHNFSWNVKLKRHVKAGNDKIALELFQQMQREGIALNKFTFVAVLNACSKLRFLDEGRRIHEHIVERGCECDIYVATCLVDMYSKCGCTEDAWSVFNKMRERDVVSWSAMILGYVKSDQGLKALELFRKMKQEGLEPNTITFTGALNACASVAAIEEGRRVHEQIIESGCEADVYVANCLVDMYIKCGAMADASSVFKKMPERDVVSWSAMIGGYVKSEEGLKAIELFRQMQEEGVEPNAVTFVGVLNACASIAALEEGRRVHEQIIQRKCESDVYVANCLVNMYAKCGRIQYAWSVFNKMREHDLVSWNAMIGGYVKSGQGLQALELFWKMQQEEVEPNAVTFVGVLNACASVAALEEGRCVHEQIIQRGYEFDIYVATCLVDMYAKCGSIDDAWGVFNKMCEHTVVSWNAMIGGYVKSGHGLKAIELFRRMQLEGVEPDVVTFIGVLNACASVAALKEGRLVHEFIIRGGYKFNVYVANCLVDMYAKCGSVEDAWYMFNKMPERDVVSWNAMIGGYLKSGQGLKVMELFREMQQEGVEPNTVTFVGVLIACANLEEGRHVHQQIRQRGHESDVDVATCLINMYVKCGSIENAWCVFNKMSEHVLVSWNAMIGGCVKSGQEQKAMELIRKMQQEGVEPNAVTFVGVLNACARVAALEEGKRVHGQISERGCESNVYVANCLVDMYAKCGSIEAAWSVFNKMPEHTVVSWNAMIGGYAMHGCPKKAIELFKRMGKLGVEINDVTFTCLLSACSHVGLVKEGLRYFSSMASRHNVLPTVEHYACMVNLLGRAGQLEEAEEMTKRIAMERNISLWMSLLGACKVHGNIKIAERAAKRCWELEPENGSGHVLLSHLYAAAGKWGRSAAIGKGRLEVEAGKEQVHTWIEIDDVVH